MRRAIGILLLAAAWAAGQSHEAGKFDYYLLSLSWSPQYCAERGVQDALQCGPGRRYGFVLHGLWPQYDPRGWPENCAAPALKPAALRSMLDIMPSERLVEHEWRRHGSCSGKDPEAYFALSREAFQAVKTPREFSGQGAQVAAAPALFKQKFLAANPRLPQESMAVLCSGRYLQEVRVCLDTKLAPRRCPSAVRDRCSVPEMIIRPVR